MKSRRIQHLKSYKLLNKIAVRANLSTIENRKIAMRCQIASGVCGPQELGLKSGSQMSPIVGDSLSVILMKEKLFSYLQRILLMSNYGQCPSPDIVIIEPLRRRKRKRFIIYYSFRCHFDSIVRLKIIYNDKLT